ncbi:MAG: cyclic pyranopterin monophosphate synthase MoaC [Polyangiaceae bacterium]|nr:cyclic pyranopterin monophosphate synthase MoaC [Polyangiaceae bacterium]
MKLYRFDEVGPDLELLPLAARRALDHAGRRLSRAAWATLSLDDRRALVAAGSADEVDTAAVTRLLDGAQPPADLQPSEADPPAVAPPKAVVEAFGDARPVAQAAWCALTPLDRYALAKVAAKGRPERLDAAWREIIGETSISTHLGPSGGARMVDVGAKPETRRVAVAESAVSMGAAAFERLASSTAAKGDVLGVARLAGIMAAKRTDELIPLCHSLSLSRVSVELSLEPEGRRVRVVAEVETRDRTGVEMEALVAASVAALTVYDMLKAYDRGMELGPTRLVSKSGGRSGDWRR